MATILNRITDIVRVNISDDIGSRFTNAQLLTFFKQAIRRIQGIGYKNRLNFMRTRFDFTLLSGATSYLLPADFIVQTGIWRSDTNEEIKHLTVDEFEDKRPTMLISSNYIDESNYTDIANYTDTGVTLLNVERGEVLSGYIIEDGFIHFIGSPPVNTMMRLRYYKDALPDNLTTSSAMPWRGKLDYVITEYVIMRALHIDRYDLSVEMSLIRDMEQTITGMYLNLDPNIGEARGPF